MVLLLLYVAITLIGLFPFQGIPILNVALGFPIGAAIAHRELGRRMPPAPPSGNSAVDPRGVLAGGAPLVSEPGACPRPVMRSVLYWSFATAGITLFVCWVQLLMTILLLRVAGLASPMVAWLPLLPSPIHPNLFRAQLFAVILSPALMVLTTVFGGVVTLLLRPAPES